MSEWVSVGAADELEQGKSRIVEVDGVMVAVFRIGDEFIAIEDSCPHDGSEIGSGCVKNGILECPHHGATFDLKSGAVLSPPAYEPLEMMQLRVEDGIVQVRDGRWD